MLKFKNQTCHQFIFIHPMSWILSWTTLLWYHVPKTHVNDLQIDTKDILFICGGAFVDLEKTISERYIYLAELIYPNLFSFFLFFLNGCYETICNSDQTARFFYWFWCSCPCQHESWWCNQRSSDIFVTWIGRIQHLLKSLKWKSDLHVLIFLYFIDLHGFLTSTEYICLIWSNIFVPYGLKIALFKFPGWKCWSHCIWTHTRVYWSFCNIS